MRCLSCDGSGLEFGFEPWEPLTNEPCKSCGGTGKAPDDEYETKLRKAISKIGMVYVLRDDVNGRVKIGVALNPLARLRNPQTGSSTRLRLLAIMPGGREGERSLHAIWPERRLSGEWFDDRDRTISRIILWSIRSEGAVWPDP